MCRFLSWDWLGRRKSVIWAFELAFEKVSGCRQSITLIPQHQRSVGVIIEELLPKVVRKGIFPHIAQCCIQRDRANTSFAAALAAKPFIILPRQAGSGLPKDGVQFHHSVSDGNKVGRKVGCQMVLHI